MWLAFNWHFNGGLGAVGKAGSQRRAAGDVLQCSRMKEEEESFVLVVVLSGWRSLALA